MFPLLIPMYGYGLHAAYNIYKGPSSSDIRTGMSDVKDSIKELGSKIEKGSVSITTDTDSILPLISSVSSWAANEKHRYDKLFNSTYERLIKIDRWLEDRKEKKKKRKEEELLAHRQALIEDAKWNYKHQPKGKWWNPLPKQSSKSFLIATGLSPAEIEETENPDSIDDPYVRHFVSAYRYTYFEYTYIHRKYEAEGTAKKHRHYDSFDDICKLNNICQQIRGATIQVPVGLMQAIAEIAAETQVTLGES